MGMCMWMLTRASSGHHFCCPPPCDDRPSLSSQWVVPCTSPLFCWPAKGKFIVFAGSLSQMSRVPQPLQVHWTKAKKLGRAGCAGVSHLTFKMPYNGLSMAALIYTHRLHVTPPASSRAHLSCPKVFAIFSLSHSHPFAIPMIFTSCS